jgi:predicted SnoaL-like aldol condensation-catalyzing enzyme
VALSILGCGDPRTAKEINQKTETVKQLKIEIMNNKEKAAAINMAVQTADFDAINQLVREDYIQHTPLIADGRKGLEGLLSKIANKEIPAPQIRNVRVFEENDIVVLHHDVNWPNRKAMIEIFRFKDGVAAEHWSGISDQPDKTANGHSMVDGDTTVTDRGNTQQNKALVRSFVETVLIRGEFNKVGDFYHPDIIQHNPLIPDGVDGLIKGIQELQSKGVTIAINKIHHVWGEGNFVLVVSEGTLSGKPTAFFDLFRTANGKVKEHWDVLQEIPAKQAHDNTMF